MMIKGIFLAIAASVLLISCGTPQGKPVDLANACSPDNEKQYLEVSGYIVPRSSVFCSNIGGGRLECGFDFSDSANGEKKMGAEIEQGSGANTVDKLPSGYKKGDIKIRDNSGNPIALNDKVRVTGKMSIAPAAPGGQGVCFMKVEKIEK
jgi:hypothetical protein